MTNQNINLKFEQAKNQHIEASIILSALGYEINVVSVPKNEAEYKELALIIIEFNKHITLANIPMGFDLCYVEEENCTCLLCKMPKTKQPFEMEENLLRASNNLLSWANTLLNT